MTSKSLSALLVLPLGLAVGCGDDSSPGGGETATDTTMPTATDTVDPTATETADPTTETMTPDPSETDPTGDPTTETDPTSDPTTDTDPTGDTETTGEPAAGSFFRFSSMAVRDPHFFADPGIGCIDITDDVLLGEAVNEQFNTAIQTDADGDGFLDLSLMLLFRDDPIMQGDGGSGDLDFANGQCAIPAAATVCDIRPGSSLDPTSYTSMAAGTCHEPDPAHLSGQGYTPAPGTTEGPCFHAGPASATIVTTAFDLPLENAEIAAQYMGDPATGLVSGTLRGFMSTATAEGIMLPKDLAGTLMTDTVAGLLPGGTDNCAGHDDTDDGGAGWWFYVDFEAETVPWNGP